MAAGVVQLGKKWCGSLAGFVKMKYYWDMGYYYCNVFMGDIINGNMKIVVLI